jgi:hypothetical protein
MSDFKVIGIERIIRIVYNKLEDKIPNLEIDDVRAIVYIHFALIKSVMKAPNFRSIRIKHLGTFMVHYNTIFRTIARMFKGVLNGNMEKEKYEERATRYFVMFEEIAKYKASKYYNFNKKDCEDYVIKNIKTIEN